MKKSYFFTFLTFFITVLTFGQCPVPTGVAVTNITSNSAAISWIGGNQTQWEIYVTPTGTTPPSAGNPGTVVTSNPYIVINLVPCTSYDVYVKTQCTPTESSNWSAAVSFTTVLPFNHAVPDMHACGMFATFNLATQNAVILGGLDPATHTVSYFLTLNDAANNSAPIPYLFTNFTSPQIIYARVQDTNSNCFGITYFSLIVNPSPVFSLPANGYICYNNTTNTAIPYTINTNLSADGYTFVWSKDGVTIAGATGSSFTTTTEGVYAVTAENFVNGCAKTATTTLSFSNAATATVDIEDQTVTINVTGQGNFQYQIDNEPAQNSNVFTNVALGTHVINIIPLNSSCTPFSVTVQVTTPSAPLGQPTQTFTPGQTLANLVVNGQNIQWYANQAAAGLTTENPLPLTTVLTNNTTYYASQTINGIESPNRLAVTVMLALNNDDFTFKKLTYYPNPVTHNLTISNQEPFTGVTISNLLGQAVLDRKVNTNQYEVDFSNLSKGIYLVKITANDQTKTFKIIKE